MKISDTSNNNPFVNAEWISVAPETDPEEPLFPWSLSGDELKKERQRKEIMSRLPWAFPAGEETQHHPMENTHGIALFSSVIEAKGLRYAVIDATALGVFDLYINGERVGRTDENGKTVYDEMKPGWTDYSKRVLYYSYDVAGYMHDGDNTILAAVTSGWWNGHISLGTYGENHVAFCASLSVEDDDGVRRLTTGETWKGSWGSAVRAADIWDGEIYDARYPSLSAVSENPNIIEWKPVTTEEHRIEISKHHGPTVMVRDYLTRQAESVVIFDGVEDNETEYGKIHVVRSYDRSEEFVLHKGEKAVVDFGQNMTGVPSFTVRGNRGVTVQLRTGEMLNNSGSMEQGNDAPAGTVFSSNLRAAKSKAYYILSGEGDESYRPTYTFFGYRYLEIAATDEIEIKNICSLVIGSDIRETGHIETSSEDVNRLISNIMWGQRSNYLSIPTDCPQRDERLGWTGDTQAFARTAAYNGDILEFLRKWLCDARDSQSDEGQYPDCIPRTRIFGEGAAAWGDAGIIVPYVLWRMYGDRTAIDEHFASMEKYMNWLATRGYDGPKAVYCDWLSVEDTDGAYISVVYYALDAGYMAEMARAVGKKDRAEHYSALREKIVEHFRSVYCDENGDLLKEYNSQTSLLLALWQGLLLPKNIQNAINRLKENIISRGYHLSTGFIGTSIINNVLAEIGENNLAYSLLMQKEMPSWLYCVGKGATTVWERWDSFTDENGFVVYGVDSSFNHYSYGALEEWIYRHVAGIDTAPDAPGFSHPVLAPKPDTREEKEIPVGEEKLTFVRAKFDSPVGVIESAWDMRDGFRYEVSVPVVSTVRLPLLSGKKEFTLNGVAHKTEEYQLSEGEDAVIIEISPGRYVFAE